MTKKKCQGKEQQNVTAKLHVLTYSYVYINRFKWTKKRNYCIKTTHNKGITSGNHIQAIDGEEKKGIRKDLPFGGFENLTIVVENEKICHYEDIGDFPPERESEFNGGEKLMFISTKKVRESIMNGVQVLVMLASLEAKYKVVVYIRSYLINYIILKIGVSREIRGNEDI